MVYQSLFTHTPHPYTPHPHTPQIYIPTPIHTHTYIQTWMTKLLHQVAEPQRPFSMWHYINDQFNGSMYICYVLKWLGMIIYFKFTFIGIFWYFCRNDIFSVRGLSICELIDSNKIRLFLKIKLRKSFCFCFFFKCRWCVWSFTMPVLCVHISIFRFQGGKRSISSNGIPHE